MTDSSPHLTLPFPDVTAQHILNCSFHSWHAKYRAKTPKARLIPLSQPFVDYLREDGIILPPESTRNDNDSGFYDADEDDDVDPSEAWSEIHEAIKATIAELGGKVVPKLNWSAPKDATWISTKNDMECTTPNEIYLLLKSSDFITHDLEQAFDGCIDTAEIPYHLVLRKSVNFNPALEIRCFVRDRKLIGITQREMNHFDFLFDLRSKFRRRIESFLADVLYDFSDPNFVFDVYIPPPHERVWLIDINPWAPRTDPLLFSWLELLTMDDLEEDITPEFRLVQRDDPEAYQFASAKYSAHKLPKDVVDASMTPSAMKDMMDEWKRVMEKEAGGEDDDNESVSTTVAT